MKRLLILLPAFILACAAADVDAGGNYYLDATLRFGPEDSGRNGAALRSTCGPAMTGSPSRFPSPGWTPPLAASPSDTAPTFRICL